MLLRNTGARPAPAKPRRPPAIFPNSGGFSVKLPPSIVNYQLSVTNYPLRNGAAADRLRHPPRRIAASRPPYISITDNTPARLCYRHSRLPPSFPRKRESTATLSASHTGVLDSGLRRNDGRAWAAHTLSLPPSPIPAYLASSRHPAQFPRHSRESGNPPCPINHRPVFQPARRYPSAGRNPGGENGGGYAVKWGWLELPGGVRR